ncbi:MAG: 2-iminoacetate synthase ThiH, partial [Muribaculaceae bacterium]|nr:2-iminoacetate synthase ThiH [Muribaculaceae bacterium]
MFSDEIKHYDWDETIRFINSRRARDVEDALTNEHPSVEDVMALISPAAVPYLEDMARLSRDITMRRFGKTISLYIPLYVSNACTNHCVYCGFNHHNPLTRTTLSMEQVKAECEAIRHLGPFENLLIVSGEYPTLNGVDYLE